MKHLRWIAVQWKGLERWLLILFLLTIVSTLAANGDPILIRELFNLLPQIAEHGNLEMGHELIGWFLPVLGYLALLTVMASFYPSFRAMINNIIELRVRERYFAELLEKDDRFFLRFRTGDLVTRLMEDIYEYPKIAWFCCSGVFRAVESTGKFLLCLGLMLWVNWELALMAIAPLPLTMFVFYLVQVRLAKAADEQRKAVSRTNEMLEACFSGARILKAFGGVEPRVEALQSELTHRIEIEMRLVKLMQIVHTIYSSINVIGMIIAFAFGANMVIEGTLGHGDLLLFLMLLEMIGPPLLDIPNLFSTSRQAFACIDRLEEIREFRTEASDAEADGAAPLDGIEAAGLEDIRIAFEDHVVLDGVSLGVNRGEKAAIVGRVGSGKSTMLRILAGLVRPDAGEVRVNDRPLGDYDLKAYRKAVGYVPQEPVLFSETIHENVVFGREDGSRLDDALSAACVRDEVMAFPDTTETMLGQRGQKVSGGQKQRLTIARALLDRPEMLLMDDVTAGLDAENEERFWKELERVRRDTTCVVVTHRIATARHMDRIHVLDDGKIVDSGTHDELLGRCELYREFQQREDLLTA
jgi:ATP-binding cassette subfamily B multidrug efflux pump